MCQPDRCFGDARNLSVTQITSHHDDRRGVAQDSANLLGYLGSIHFLVKAEVHNKDIRMKSPARKLKGLRAAGSAVDEVAVCTQQHRHRFTHWPLVFHMQNESRSVDSHKESRPFLNTFSKATR